MQKLLSAPALWLVLAVLFYAGAILVGATAGRSNSAAGLGALVLLIVGAVLSVVGIASAIRASRRAAARESR
jgi:hypothetical protein